MRMSVRYIPFKKKDQTDENSDTWDTVDWLIQNLQTAMVELAC